MLNLLKEAIGPILAVIVVSSGFVMMYLKPETKTEIIGLMTLVLSFYFGSSKGSQDKDKVIETTAKTAALTSAEVAKTLAAVEVAEDKREG
jgi:hypothetical protein